MVKKDCLFDTVILRREPKNLDALVPEIIRFFACSVESRLRRVRVAEFHRVNLRLISSLWLVNCGQAPPL